ncbi:hypothetical protein F4V43_07840 [Paenibacillus spiritus]|uniref:Uncharacterized protein n=1 Tax=Paenibacillus spiritus TaxID=2496557 RepID=A0A5J5GD53_9BACL|nr:hypothetical protein [Paenibacillus spiritus]KAA9005374.1 hypothetical protein F4V43_07840 [Paenibacillus spiritus]
MNKKRHTVPLLKAEAVSVLARSGSLYPKSGQRPPAIHLGGKRGRTTGTAGGCPPASPKPYYSAVSLNQPLW